ncbi:O-antigen ligase family protein [Eubacterium oxidoreducens]|uniref:O-Antigen ligase n=1 Tax=Eubacterium oxidoreducens TaxID=1732 RepID=A0A1G6B6Y0_EUBOX|nr:O-antigen ligase family protein [Eubacterium oxidoreducens]SDB16163.1 O-Antigen ligase [Eubacterium oxidoreducens]
MNKQQIRRNEKLTWTKIMTEIFLIGMLAVYPLIEWQGYEKILQGKAIFFFIAVPLYLVLAVLFRYFEKSLKRNHYQKKNVDRITGCGLLFLIALTISWLCAPLKGAAFWGTDCRYVGYAMLVLMVLCFFVVRELAFLRKYAYYIIGIAAAFIFVIAIFNHLGFNPLGLCETFDNRKSSFISTLGNRNTMAAYASLMLAVAIPLFLFAKKKRDRRFLGVFLFLGYMAMAATNSDSVYLVLGAVLAITLYRCLKTYSKLLKWAYNGIILSCAWLLDCLLRNVRGQMAWKKDGVLRFIFRHHVMEVVLVAMIILVIICVVMKMKQKETIPKPIALVMVIVVVCVVAFYIVMLIVSVRIWNPIEAKYHLGVFKKFLYFTDSWGTNRGRIWRACINTFANMPLVHKIFGMGCGMSYQAFETYDHTNVADYFSATLVDAHNEFLQYLITTGIVGVVSYFGFLFMLLKNFVKQSIRGNETAFIGICFIGGFLAQGAVNNTHIYIEPLAFIILALITGKISKSGEKIWQKM